jgi:hypothetical protein
MPRPSPSSLRLLAPALVLAFALSAVISLHAQFSAQQQQQAAAVPPGQITGHVYRTDTGEPIAKAIITAVPRFAANQGGPGGRGGGPNGNMSEARSAITGADGSFIIDDVVPADYVVRASHTGYVAQAFGQDRTHGPRTVTVAASQTLDRVDIRLIPAGVITGAIVDQDGDPLESVNVSAVQLRYQRGGQVQENVENAEETDDQGNFRLSGLNPGAYLIQANAGNRGRFGGVAPPVAYAPAYFGGGTSAETAQPIQVDAGATITGIRIGLVAQQTHSIVGQIVDSGPGAGRRYTIQVMQGESGPRGGTFVRPDGSFVVRNVTPGEYTLMAIGMNGGPDSAGGSVPGYASVVVGDADASVMIEVGRAGEVRGNVMEASGQTAAYVGHRLQLQPVMDSSSSEPKLGMAGGTLSTPQLDSSGTFDFKEVPPGHFNFSLAGQAGVYVKQASCGGQDYSERPIEILSSTVLDRCQIILASDTGSVSGQVTDGANAVSGMLVVLVPDSRDLRQVPRYTFTANSDNYGNFQINGVIPGDYTVFAVEPRDDQAYFSLDYADQHSRESAQVTVAANQSQTVNLRPIGRQ